MPEQKEIKQYRQTKRCPCCSAKARVSVTSTLKYQIMGQVQCKGCFLKIERFVAGNIPDGRFLARTAAVSAWNMRVATLLSQTK